MTNHEIRCLILALWWIGGAAERVDMLAEMRHYADRTVGEMPPVTRDLIRAYEAGAKR